MLIRTLISKLEMRVLPTIRSETRCLFELRIHSANKKEQVTWSVGQFTAGLQCQLIIGDEDEMI